MKIKVVDTNNKTLKDVTLKFIIKEKFVEYTSDQNGFIKLDNVQDNEIIKYYSDNEVIEEFKYYADESIMIAFDVSDTNMLFIISNHNAEPATNTRIAFKFGDKEVNKTSNNRGEIILEGIPINAEIKSYQLTDDNELINEQTHKHSIYQKQYFISLEKLTDRKTITFKLVDQDDKIIKNLTTIRFKIDGEEFERESKNFDITIKDVKIGSKIECKQIIDGRDLPWQKFKCKRGQDVYMLKCESAAVVETHERTSNSKAKMKFRLVDSGSNPIPNAVVCIESDSQSRNKYTNRDGEVISDEMVVGDKVIVSVDLKGNKLRSIFVCQGDDEIHKLVLKNDNKKYYIIVIVLLLIAAAILYFATNGDNSSEKSKQVKQEIPKEKPKVINTYYFKISDIKGVEPIEKSNISINYKDTTIKGVTDDSGILKVKSILDKKPIEFTVSKLGFQPITKKFTLDSVFNINMQPDTLVYISKDVGKCDIVVKSNGAKTSYHSYKMQINKGRFRIWFNLFKELHRIKVYNSDVNNISSDNLIYDSSKSQIGILNSPYINYNGNDGIVTICMISDKVKSNWVYKVYCARSQTASYPKPTTSN